MADERKKYIIEFVADTAGALKVRQAMQQLTGQQGRLRDSSKSLGDELFKLYKRALLTIPVWLSLRTAVNAISTEFRDGVQYIIDFDKALARAGAVTSGVKNIDSFLNNTLKPLARQLSVETGKSATEASEAFYRFGTAGVAAEDSIAGMSTSVRLATALMGDVTTTATSLADVYKILGDSVTDATTPQEKLEKIAGTITILYKRNAFELSQFAQAMQKAGASASLANVSFEQMSALIATVATFGLRGARAGTALERAFRYLEIRADLVNSILGDKSNGVNSNFEKLILLIEQLNNKPLAGGLTQINKDLAEIFGVRGAQGVAIVAKNLATLRANYEAISKISSKQAFAVTLEELQRQTDTIKTQLEIFRNLRRIAFEAFVTAATGSADFTESLKTLNTFIQNDLIPGITAIGTVAGIAFATMRDLVDLLNAGGLTNLSPLVAISRILNPRAGATSQLQSTLNLLKRFSEGRFTGQKDIITIFGEQLKSIKGQVDAQTYLALAKGFREAADAIQAGSEGLFEQEGALNVRLRQLESLKLLGFSDLEIAKQKLAILKEEVDTGNKRLQLEEDILKLEQQQVSEIGNKFRSGFEEGLRSLIDGGGLQSLGDKIKEAISGAFKDELVGGITDVVASTGLFAGFGNLGARFRSSFQGIRGTIVDAHVEGIKKGFQQVSLASAFAGSPTTSGQGLLSFLGTSGSTLLGGLKAGAPLKNIFGSIGTNFQSAGGLKGLLSGGGQTVSSLIAASLLTGGAASGGVGGALSSFGLLPLLSGGAFKSLSAATFGTGGIGASAGGLAGLFGGLKNLKVSPFLAGLGALGGGLQAFQSFRSGNVLGGIGGSLSAAGSLLSLVNPALGIPLALAGSITSLFGGGKSKTSVQEQVREISTSSKIDVTNRKLEIINRNLVAFKTSFDTYILPSSSFFSESRGNSLADQYALASVR